ncbi:hypothetical protein ACE6H2_027314 [Prunus campanulata]
MQTLLDAKSLTSLNLEFVVITDDSNNDPPIGRLPCLKTVSLTTVDINYGTFAQLISSSPSLEHLSVFIRFPHYYNYILPSSSLKSFEVRIFNSDVVQVSGAESLEYCTLVLKSPEQIKRIRLDRCKNLKHLSIRAPQLPNFTLQLHGCKHLVNASLDIPNLDWTRINSNVEWRNFYSLANYLGKFRSFKNISLYVYDAEALIFPKNMRKFYDPPLRTVNTLTVFLSSPRGARDSELRHSLFWLGPNLKSIEITMKWNSKAVEVSGAKNLESFTLDSFNSMQFESTRLYGCKNLKYLNIDAPDLADFTLHGCNDRVKATLHVPNLDCVRCTVFGTWGPSSTLTDYLEKFDCFKELSLYVEDVEVRKAKLHGHRHNTSLTCPRNPQRPPIPSHKTCHPHELSMQAMGRAVVILDDMTFGRLTSGSPCLEHLSVSLISDHIHIPRSSIKSLQVTNINSTTFRVSGAKNLESFTLISECSTQIESIRLDCCKNLKYLNIRAPDLQEFTLEFHGRKDRVKATVDSQTLDYPIINFLGKESPCHGNMFLH